MKPEDKFGRKIFPRIFKVLKRYGGLLSHAGWKESKSKPNLFYKTFGKIAVFADMRGTDVVPIWDNPYPLLYASSGEKDWKRRRAIRYAVNELESIGVPYRFSFFDMCEPDGLFFGDEDELPDGRCKLCGDEINCDELFCSEKCRKAFLQLKELSSEEQKQNLKCRLCGKVLTLGDRDTIKHHIDYDKDKTIIVCRSCHKKIHIRHEKYPDLAPKKPKE